MDIFEKFDNAYNLEGLKNDITEAKENGGDFKEVPTGNYEVMIEKMELTKSKSEKPMVSIWFKIVQGDFKNSRIFYNQLVDEGFKINIVNTLLESLDSGVDVYFESFKQYNDLILDIHEAIDKKLEYLLEYSENDKGYKTYKIKEVYDA